MKSVILQKLKKNWTICAVIVISLILHILAIAELGFEYTLGNDDASYVRSGITFLETGKITMHELISAQIMPGMTFMIAFFALLFGTGTNLMIALKIFYLCMSLITIYVIYRTVRLYTNQYVAAIPCLFFLAVDYIWMDNLTLTETPYMLLFALLIYHTLHLSIKTNQRDYICIVFYYIAAVFIRPNIGIYPIFLFIFLWLKKYDFKLLMRQCLVAGLILIAVLTPWIYRNYQVFGKFIPLTYGMGNPLLLGTYQGVGYPLDEELNYKVNVDDKMTEEMQYYLENPEEKDYMTGYYSLERDGMKAKYRMQEWWDNDKVSMIKSYCYFKPYILIYNYFYWDSILGIEDGTGLLLLRKIEIIIFLVCSIIILLDKKKIKEWLFLMLAYGSQIALYSYSFAFDRYAITMFFFRYIIIGIGIGIVWQRVQKRRNVNEGISDYSSI